MASKKALEKNQNSSSQGGTSGANSVSITPLTTSSSSRQRIRDILQKQREESERQNKEKEDVERKVSSSFDPSKNKLFVDYPFIFSGSINYIKEIINSKKYGQLTEIESFREQAPIRSDADVVWDLGVHDISILKYLCMK